MSDAEQSPQVIDLTEEAAAAVHSITPELQRPIKQRRISRRIQDRARESSEDTKSCETDDATGDNKATSTYSVESGEPTAKRDTGVTYRKNDYYEVESILERRTKNFGGDSAAGGRNVVEYLVKWKNPPDYTGEGSYWEDSWQIAENLDPHSLAVAFRLFPMDGDPDRNSNETAEEIESEESELELDLGDDLFDDDDDDDDAEVEEEIMLDGGEDDGEEMDAQTCQEISHLGESEYDSPGTVEVEINRKTYRVGQSFISPDGDVCYTISTILPIQRKAKCLKYIKMEACFACPKGKEDMFIQLSDEVVLDLSMLKSFAPAKSQLKKFPMKYDESENQRSFCFRNESAKVHHHPIGKPTVLELFAGVGGMSLGLERAGFNVKWVVDSDEVASAALTANKWSSNMNTDVYTEKLSSFLKNCIQGDPAYPKPGEVDHIHGSPPCKGFSRANRNGGKDDILNNKQTLLFVKAIQHFRPKTLTFENVAGLLTPDFRGYLKSVVASLLTMQYQVRVQVYNASSYGDPQHRRRLFILASRHDCLLPSSPLPTHGIGRDLIPIKTCKDALEIFDKEPTKSGAVMSLSANTKIWNHIAPRIAPNKEKDYELKADEPSRTVLARARPHVHYNGNRYISVREAAALQSFPSDYRFFGSISSQYSQVGNAVPICLATAISRSVIRVHGAP